MSFERLRISGHRDGVLAAVAGLAIDIDPVPDNRSKAETEWWILQHSIASLPGVAGATRLRIDHGDRPDFSLQLDNLEVGIEVTECIPPAVGSLIRNAALDDNVRSYSATDAWMNPNGVKSETIERYLQPGHVPPPLRGNEPEVLMARGIVESLKKKADSVRKPGFETHPENWILMYDRSGPGGVRMEEAIELAQGDIAELPLQGNIHRVFILSSDRVFDVIAYD